MTGRRAARASLAVGAAILLLGVLPPGAARGVQPGDGTITPWQARAGDAVTVEVVVEGWACPSPRTAEVGFHWISDPWGDPGDPPTNGYGASWGPATADADGRRFGLVVPSLRPGPYDVFLRCDGGAALYIAAESFGSMDAYTKAFTVIPVVGPGDLSPILVGGECDLGAPVHDVWISPASEVTRPTDPRLAAVRIVRREWAVEGLLELAWFQVPRVAPGAYYLFFRDCVVGAFRRAARPAAPGYPIAPGLVVVGMPDSATGPHRATHPTGALIVVAFVIGVAVSLRRTRARVPRAAQASRVRA